MPTPAVSHWPVLHGLYGSHCWLPQQYPLVPRIARSRQISPKNAASMESLRRSGSWSGRRGGSALGVRTNGRRQSGRSAPLERAPSRYALVMAPRRSSTALRRSGHSARRRRPWFSRCEWACNARILLMSMRRQQHEQSLACLGTGATLSRCGVALDEHVI